MSSLAAPARRVVVASLLAVAVAVGPVSACSTGEGSGSGDPPAAAPGSADGTNGSTASPTSLERELRSFTVVTTGDLLLHMPVQRRALANGGGSTYDFTPMFSEIAPAVEEADLAFCHMETPLSPDDTDLSGYPLFNTAKEIAAAAAAVGFDACSTASNHSLDQGVSGITATLDELDRVGLGHVGTARDESEASRPDLHDVKGVRVAHLDYTYGTNGIPVPSATPWVVNLVDVDRILADAHEARAAGADVVIVEMHWGLEYQSLPTDEQKAQAAALSDSADIDLVIGQHVHVVQAAERRANGEYVIYGTGNLLSNQGTPATPVPSNDGVIVAVTFAEQPDGSWSQSVTYRPTYVDRSSYLIRYATPQTNAASYDRTVAALNGLGPGTFDGVPIS